MSISILVRKADTLGAGALKSLEPPFNSIIGSPRKFLVLGPLTPALTIAIITIGAREPLSVLTDSNFNSAAKRVDADERFDCLGHDIISSVDNSV